MNGKSADPIPLPPVAYQRLVCGPVPELEEHFEEVGSLLAGWLVEAGLAGPGLRLLDVGCGCGRVARHLVGLEGFRYAGFDRHPGMIEWCRHEIGSRYPHFEFTRVNVSSVYDPRDGHRGTVAATDFAFPYADAVFDSVLLASVLSHMPLHEAATYLRECRRVLRPDGRVLGSVMVRATADFDPKLDVLYEAEAFWSLVYEVGLEAVDGRRDHAWVPGDGEDAQRWFCVRPAAR